MNDPKRPYVVTVTPTIMSGTVVRWHESVTDAERVEPIISASRDAVIEHSSTLVTDYLRAEANEAHRLLRRGDREAAQSLATHRFSFGMRQAMPIERGSS